MDGEALIECRWIVGDGETRVWHARVPCRQARQQASQQHVAGLVREDLLEAAVLDAVGIDRKVHIGVRMPLRVAGAPHQPEPAPCEAAFFRRYQEKRRLRMLLSQQPLRRRIQLQHERSGSGARLMRQRRAERPRQRTHHRGLVGALRLGLHEHPSLDQDRLECDEASRRGLREGEEASQHQPSGSSHAPDRCPHVRWPPLTC